MAAKMIPYDARVRIVDAYRRHGNAREMADMFGVSTREYTGWLPARMQRGIFILTRNAETESRN